MEVKTFTNRNKYIQPEERILCDNYGSLFGPVRRKYFASFIEKKIAFFEKKNNFCVVEKKKFCFVEKKNLRR